MIDELHNETNESLKGLLLKNTKIEGKVKKDSINQRKDETNKYYEYGYITLECFSSKTEEMYYLTILVKNKNKSSNYNLNNFTNKVIRINKINKIYIPKNKFQIQASAFFEDIEILSNYNDNETKIYKEIETEQRQEEIELRKKKYKNIALITSKTSEGYTDFMSQLRGTHYFNIYTFFTNMNDLSKKENLIKIISDINLIEKQKRGIDIICIIRGGGQEMALFNDSSVAMAIYCSNIPVLIGVGHAKYDLLIKKTASIVAITPTNAAEILLKPYKTTCENAEIKQSTPIYNNTKSQQSTSVYHNHKSNQQKQSTAYKKQPYDNDNEKNNIINIANFIKVILITIISIILSLFFEKKI